MAGGVSGVRPVRTVAKAASGLVTSPYRAYPRVLRGLQSGVAEGLTATFVESCNVLTTLSVAIQTGLELTQGKRCHAVSCTLSLMVSSLSALVPDFFVF